MKKWVQNSLCDALLKALALLAAAHIVFLLIGWFAGSEPSVLGMKMLWAHFSLATFTRVAIVAVVFLLLWWLFTRGEQQSEA